MPLERGASGSDRLATRAPAKVNLTLCVLGRRPDGYHELDSLVAFAGAADDLALAPGDRLSLVVDGSGAAATGPTQNNLILKAARALIERRPGLRAGAFRLVKRLPAAAGLGGGSSDAAAALRLLGRLNGLRLDDPVIWEAARATGADVPICLTPRMRMMRGIGDVLGPPLAATRFFAVLVNPGVPVETAGVFRNLKLKPGERHHAASATFPAEEAGDARLSEIIQSGNDLEAPAIAAEPVISEALEALRRQPGCALARMSGSGATVFGLFADCRQTAAAAKALAAPGWWVKATILR